MRKDVSVRSSHKTSHIEKQRCRVAVIWIDWYAYHVARFKGLAETAELEGEVAGIELVGGVGVHAGLKFREPFSEDIAVHTLMPNSSWSEAGQLTLALKLWRYLTKLRPEAVLVPGYYTLPGLASALWARTHGALSVLMTESTYDDHTRSRSKERIKSFFLRLLFHKAITGGTAHRRYLAKLRFPEERIGRYYDVVDNKFFLGAAETLRRDSTPDDFGLPSNFFLYIGRLSPEKNVDGLLLSWLAYRQQGGAWDLVLVGDGPSAALLRKFVADTPFSGHVQFAGHRTSLELPPYYSHAKCFVLPSTREPWGLVVNEALASGLPVLVSNRCGCAEDLVTEGNGFTFDPFAPQELARFLLKMEKLSDLERSRMGHLSVQISQIYSPANFGIEVANLCRVAHRQVENKTLE